MSIIKKSFILLLPITLIIITLSLVKINESKDISNNSILELCDFERYNKTSQNCLRMVIKYAIDKNSYKDLIRELDKAEAKYADFFSFCHTVTHSLGNYALESYKDINTLLEDTTYETCGGGMSHGALFSYLAQPDISEMDIGLLVKACLESVNAPTCSHGIGHAFASSEETEVALDKCMKSSLVYVDKNKEISANGFAHSCNYGVIMEKFAPFGSIRLNFNIENKAQAADYCVKLYRDNFNEKSFDVDRNSIMISLVNGCAAGVGFSYGSEIMSKLMGKSIDIESYDQTFEYIDNCTKINNIGAEYSLKYNPNNLRNMEKSLTNEEVLNYIYGCQIQTLLNTSNFLFINLDSIDEINAKEAVTSYKEFCSNFAKELDNDKYDLLIRNFYNDFDFNRACDLAAVKNKSLTTKERYLKIVSLL